MTQDIREQPTLYLKDTTFIQEEHVTDEHISQLQTDQSIGLEIAHGKCDDAVIPINESVQMFQFDLSGNNVRKCAQCYLSNHMAQKRDITYTLLGTFCFRTLKNLPYKIVQNKHTHKRNICQEKNHLR